MSWTVISSDFTPDCLDVMVTSPIQPNGLKLRQVRKPFQICISDTESPDIINIVFRKGWQTDLASIPEQAQVLVGHPTDDEWIVPALIHDAAFATHFCDLDTANTIIRDLLCEFGMAWVKAEIVYAALELFSAGPWAESYLKTDRKLINVTRKKVL